MKKPKNNIPKPEIKRPRYAKVNGAETAVASMPPPMPTAPPKQPTLQDMVQMLIADLVTLENHYVRVLSNVANMTVGSADGFGQRPAFDARCVEEARTHVQSATMWAVRAMIPPQQMVPQQAAPAPDKAN
jgi:hypothetical protein